MFLSKKPYAIYRVIYICPPKAASLPFRACGTHGAISVDTHFIGLGLGGALVADALQRTLKSDIAAYAMVVDAKDETAVAFYQHHGFIRLTDSPLTLFLPLATAQKMIDNTSRR